VQIADITGLIEGIWRARQHRATRALASGLQQARQSGQGGWCRSSQCEAKTAETDTATERW